MREGGEEESEGRKRVREVRNGCEGGEGELRGRRESQHHICEIRTLIGAL